MTMMIIIVIRMDIMAGRMMAMIMIMVYTDMKIMMQLNVDIIIIMSIVFRAEYTVR